MNGLHIDLRRDWKLPDDPKEALLQISKWLNAASTACEKCSDDFGSSDYFKFKIPVEFAYDIQGYAHEAARVAALEQP